MDQGRKSLGSMWLRACEMLNEAERLERQFFRLSRVERYPVWEPPVDIFETERGLLIRVALPDVDIADIEVAMDGGRLRITGQRRLPEDAKHSVIHNLEIPYGFIERRIALPIAYREVEDSNYRNGCLEIRVRRGETKRT